MSSVGPQEDAPFPRCKLGIQREVIDLTATRIVWSKVNMGFEWQCITFASAESPWCRWHPHPHWKVSASRPASVGASTLSDGHEFPRMALEEEEINKYGQNVRLSTISQARRASQHHDELLKSRWRVLQQSSLRAHGVGLGLSA